MDDFLSGTNPPIRQKIPRVVSLCHFQRAPEPLAFQLPHYRIKPKVQGELTVRFPTIRRLTVVGLEFSKELRTDSP